MRSVAFVFECLFAIALLLRSPQPIGMKEKAIINKENHPQHHIPCARDNASVLKLENYKKEKSVKKRWTKGGKDPFVRSVVIHWTS